MRSDTQNRRPIRSFVLRTGRITPGQERAVEENWQRWGLEHNDSPLDFDKEFGRSGVRVLEIGFGMGQSLVAMAHSSPAVNFVGVEVHRPGVGKLFHAMIEQDVDNIRAYCHDAVEILRDCIAVESLDTVQIFFPDPWHKKRHHKRRLIQSEFVAKLITRIKPGGILHLATDWENYALQMMEVLSANAELTNSSGEGVFTERPENRPLTKFERRGERLGHGVWDLVFVKK